MLLEYFVNKTWILLGILNFAHPTDFAQSF